MIFTYTHFGSTPIPAYNVQHDIGAGPVTVQSFRMQRGAYVPAGRKPLQEKTIALRGFIQEADTLTVETVVRALRARIGERDQLWREWASGTREWTWATLADLPAGINVPSPFTYGVEQGLALLLEYPVWYAEQPTVLTFSDLYDDSAGSDLLLLGSVGTSPGTFVPLSLVNTGNYANANVLIELTAGAYTINSLAMHNITTDYEFSWAGTLTTGTTLSINTGASSVYRGVTAAYAEFTPPSNQSLWMELAPGVNTINVTITDAATDSQTAADDTMLLTFTYYGTSV